VLVHTFDDHYGAASFASGWSACVTGLGQVLDGRPVEPAGRHVAEHEAFVVAFGLDEGIRSDGPDGWRVRFERQLTVPAEDAWGRRAGPGDAPAPGEAPPAGAVAEEFPALAVTQARPPRTLEYSWAAGPAAPAGQEAGSVRWELGQGTGHGARLVLTQTGPVGAGDAAATALAVWRARIAALAEELSAAARP
jgi:hypothetical protein